MPSCIVKGCTYSWKKKDPDIIIHAFPKDLESIKKWLLQTKQDFGDLEEFSRKILEGTKGAYRVCSRHFTADSYETRGFMTALKKGAIPTIFPDVSANMARSKKTKIPAKRSKIDSSFSTYGGVPGVGYKPSTSAWPSPSAAPHNFTSPIASADMYVQGLCMFTAGGRLEIHHDQRRSSYSEQNMTEESRRMPYCPTLGPLTGLHIHQSTNTEPFVGTSNKKVQANRREKHHSVGIQCNPEDLPIEKKHYPFRISLRNFDVLIWADPFRKKTIDDPRSLDLV